MALKFACVSGLGILFSALVACSGAESTELFGEPATESGGTLPAPSPTPTNPTPSPGTGTGDPKQDPPKQDPPPGGTCAAEVEPNNNRNTSTAFTSCVNGKLASQNDVDNLVVKAPAIAKSMVIKTSGTGGRIQFSVNGGNFLVGVNETWSEDDDAPTVPVVPEETYSFQVRTSSGGERTWKVEVAFE